MSAPQRSADGESRSTSTIIVLALLVAAAVAWGVGGNEESASSPPPDLSNLVASTTNSVLKEAPRDPKPRARTEGKVVRPQRMVAIYDRPDGEAFGKVGPKQFGPTWLPVINEADGWVQVLLPSRPNGSTGWLPTGELKTKKSSHLIRAHLGSRTLELFHKGQRVGSWAVAIGKQDTPTPVGRTFVLGSITDPGQSYSPVILPLGSHSETLDTYGGGPGTVALHGWSDSSVFGSAVSHGCIRVPSDALDQLSRVPLGTVVVVDRK